MTPVHPCGTVMDVMRRGYCTKMRLWQADDTEIPVRWFEADPGANWFGGDNQYGSSNWDSLPQYSPVGEDWPRERTYDRSQNLLGYRGVGFCGAPEVWARGAIHGVDPVFAMRANGSSVCCDLPESVGPVVSGSGLASWVWTVRLLGIGTALTSLVSRWYIVRGPIGTGTSGAALQRYYFYQQSWIGTGTALIPVGGGIQSGSGLISLQGSDVPSIGDYKWAFSVSPSPGWLLCDGSYFSGTFYTALATMLGSTFGAPVGILYKLPEANSRILICGGGAPPLSFYTTGNTGGVESVTLAVGQGTVESHQHSYQIGTGQGCTGGVTFPVAPNVSNAGNTAAATTRAALSAHENRQPYICIGYLFIYAGP